MIRRLVLVVAAACLLVPPAHAAELQLAGIRLGQQAMELFSQEPYGPPLFFGPAGTTITWGIAPTAAAAPAAPISYGVAAPAAPAAPAAAPAAGVIMRPSFAPEEEELAAPPAGPMTGIAEFAQPMAAPVVAPPPQAAGAIYWFYSVAEAQVVIGIDAGGGVQSILVTGRSWAGGATQRGVRLGDGYLSVLDKHGFPDSTTGAGGNLVLSYAEARLTVTLVNLRVASILLR